jgi:hypothetical protein
MTIEQEKQIDKYKNKVLEHYNATFVGSPSSADVYLGKLETEDCYEIYFIDHNPNISPTRLYDVALYYYDHDLVDEVRNYIIDNLNIYIEEDVMDAVIDEDFWIEMYNEIEDDE